MIVAGDITEITFNNPDIGSGTVFPKSNEDATIDLGGFRSNDDADMLTADGEMIDQMNNKRWSVEPVLGWDNNEKLELEKFVALAGVTSQTDFTFTHISGTVWGGRGKPVGDIQGNSNQGTFTVKLSGGGKLTKIV